MVLRSDGVAAVGQLLDASAQDGEVVKTGRVLGSLEAGGSIELGTVRPFEGASIELAARDVWEALERGRSADMQIGSARAGPALLSSSSFNRHTFMCGQSGSGKSYAMGVLLEQLLIDSDLQMIVLDPNGDFVGLGDTLVTAEPDERERLGSVEVRVFRRDASENGELLACQVHRPEPRGQGGGAAARTAG